MDFAEPTSTMAEHPLAITGEFSLPGTHQGIEDAGRPTIQIVDHETSALIALWIDDQDPRPVYPPGDPPLITVQPVLAPEPLPIRGDPAERCLPAHGAPHERDSGAGWRPARAEVGEWAPGQLPHGTVRHIEEREVVVAVIWRGPSPGGENQIPAVG
jgi:hypothetical protein